MSLPGRAQAWERDPVLSALLIQQMVADSAGFRWVATDEGVFRYDGYELVSLNDFVRNGARLPVETVNALTLDRRGHLWIGANNGLYSFYPRTSYLQRLKLPPSEAESPAVYALLCHPRTGRLWVQAGTSVLRLDPDRPAAAVASPIRVQYPGYQITPEANGGVWLTTHEWYHFQLAPDGTQQRALWHPGWPVPDTQPLRLIEPGAVVEIDTAGQTRTLLRWAANSLPMYRPYVTDSACDYIRQNQWVHVAGYRGAHPTVRVTPVALATDGGDQRQSSYLNRDAQGTWWCFWTMWRGCFKLRQAQQVVQPLRLTNGRPLPSARAINRLPDGRLVVSTYGGLFAQAADSPTAPLRPFPLYQLAPQRRPAGGVFFGILWPRQQPYAALADEVWGFSQLDWQANLRSAYLAYNQTLTRTRCLLQDQTGQLWGGAQPGLFQLDSTGRRLTRYADDRAGWPLHKLEINALAEDSANHALWIATSGGLFWLRPADGRLRAFTVAATTDHPLPTNALLPLLPAGPGRVWVGTRDQGLLLFDLTKGIIRHLNVADGLPSHTVVTLLADRRGHLWAGTYAGLVRYTPATGHLAIFQETAGLDQPELNRCSAFADRDGTLWFGGVGGVYRVPPVPVERVSSPLQAAPRLLVSSVAVPAADGASQQVQLLTAGISGPLTVGVGPTAFVELRLALTDFYAPALTRYAYRLRTSTGEMLTTWLNTPRQLLLRGLSPGDYEIEVRAETAPGQPAANRVRVPLHVAAPWFQWPVVWVLAAGLLVALGYGVYWLRLRRVLREAHLRSELAANLHDEVGALLTRVNMLAEVLRDQHLTPAPAESLRGGSSDSGSTFERLLVNSRAAVQTMRDVVWGIDARADTVGALIDRMRDHLDQTAEAAGIKARFVAEGLADTDAIAPMLRQHLYLIFKEAVTNAVRHGLNVSEVCVRLVSASGLLTLTVTDDGQHHPAPRTGTEGMGVRNMQQRAAQLGADLLIGQRADGRMGYEVKVRVAR